MTKDRNSTVRLVARAAVAFAILCFISLDRNPVVWLEARLGLSPCPLERYFHAKSAFSGMTEGLYQLARMDFGASLRSNCLSPLALLGCLALVVTGHRPRICSRHQELLFFGIFLALSVLVNIVN